MKKLFLVLTVLGLVLDSACAGYIVLKDKLGQYAKSDEVVSSVHDLDGDVGLEAGDNVSITTADNSITIAADGAPAQVQSDWTEPDSGSPAYIDNKPEVLASNTVAEISRYVVDELTSTGWEVDGTWYKLVVQPFDPPTPTTFILAGGTEETWNILGALDNQWMEDAGYFDIGSHEWLKPVIGVNIGTGVTSLGSEVFYRCLGLTNVVIPDSVTSVGFGAFYRCSGLTNVTVGAGVTNISGYMFSDCYGLERIVIPDNVTSIGDFAFRACTSLTDVTIGTGVTSIGSYAFGGCDSLMSVAIPDNVTTIGAHAFGENGPRSVDMSGRTAATVRGMSDFSWDLPSGCVITCSGGETITIP